MDSNPKKKVSVRFLVSAELHSWLKKRATINDRSISGELFRILKDTKAKSEQPGNCGYS